MHHVVEQGDEADEVRAGREPRPSQLPLFGGTQNGVNSYRDRVSDILANAERYHRAYYQAEAFRGPSLYFHQSTPQHMDPERWVVLNQVFQGIKVMASGTSLVGNSKVMHHMMPNIVPPIDREYTLRYLRGNTNITTDLDREWHTMKAIISDFFIPIACDAEFDSKARKWMASQDEFPWDTSASKVVDNLVSGSRK